jgi:glycosyltransferase involved in cell wall biosynthesis
MRFSLVLATLGRTDELYRLFNSLCAQTHRDFEVIVVDGGPESGVLELVQEYKDRLCFRHVGSVKGHSKALNLGLRSAEGDVIAFPDDDCWYPPHLLAHVAQQLQIHPGWAGLTGRAITETGIPSSGKWDRRPGPLTRYNVWRRAVTISMFLRKSAIHGNVFDESLGVGAGTPWGAGEETDFLLQVLRRGSTVHFLPTVTVNHPEWGRAPYTDIVRTKAHSYGRGIGRVLRKHGYPLTVVAYHLMRPLGGMVLASFGGQIRKARYHWSIFTGRMTGWRQPPSTSQACTELTSQEPAK